MKEKIRIGILGPSEIAKRRFAPAVMKSDNLELVGVASANAYEWSDKPLKDESVVIREYEKAKDFADSYSIDCYDSYEKLLLSDIDAVYIPLPPGLHYKWAKKALEQNKHILLEKPFTTSLEQTKDIIEAAENRGLAVHEDFAFIFHKQIEKIDALINNGQIGELRLIRAAFGFPYRGSNDFRYNKALGGGALLDCGGYPIKLADHLLGGNSHVAFSVLSSCRNHDVDVFGNAVLINDNGVTAQIAFGMDNSYKCDVEIWGSEGYISTGRIYSPPADYSAVIKVNHRSQTEDSMVMPDDQFLGSAEYFANCITDSKTRVKNYNTIIHQAELFEVIKGV